MHSFGITLCFYHKHVWNSWAQQCGRPFTRPIYFLWLGCPQSGSQLLLFLFFLQSINLVYVQAYTYSMADLFSDPISIEMSLENFKSLVQHSMSDDYACCTDLQLSCCHGNEARTSPRNAHFGGVSFSQNEKCMRNIININKINRYGA